MLRIYRLLIILSALTALTVLAGCGPNTTSNATGQSTTPAGPSSTTATKLSLTPTGSSTVAVKGGSVTLRTGAGVYQIRATITVTLSNQNIRTIYFPDHLTNCSVILLQRQEIITGVNRGFQPVNLCRLGIHTRMHALGARQSLVVKLAAPLRGWLPGTYQAVLSYYTTTTAGGATTISSAAFQVGPFPPVGRMLLPQTRDRTAQAVEGDFNASQALAGTMTIVTQ